MPLSDSAYRSQVLPLRASAASRRCLEISSGTRKSRLLLADSRARNSCCEALSYSGERKVDVLAGTRACDAGEGLELAWRAVLLGEVDPADHTLPGLEPSSAPAGTTTGCTRLTRWATGGVLDGAGLRYCGTLGEP